MVNINMTHVFKHPKFYRIPRDKSDQAISKRQPTGESERASWSGPQASSGKLQAPSVKLSNQPEQASSDKHPNHNHKRQATSLK
jgi:hypothetical protein